ncbi:hypothetical protein SDC9_51090 [bioreactor metagenome]|uniref:HTH cro/C1-type domain-containing protein n=1 Tax=bioreactor metagenome TaxID=1076179 RepID=A0A644WMG1_9ZZZZ|nr:helix-turn-helix transcriptional regulator [Sedimentibacter saalensis]MEA5094967.1 helix-turn-helix transcriptional regulator [Sedimentibacter saalensis]
MLLLNVNKYKFVVRCNILQVSYKKLWKLLIDKNMKKTDLQLAAGISAGTLAKLGRSETVSMDILMRICIALSCDIGDIIEFINDSQNKNI